MKDSRLWAGLLGVVCGAELVLAVIIGGAGVGAILGLEGALVAAAAIFIAGTYLKRRRDQGAAHLNSDVSASA